jgi:long-chain acyl-CoA synthetase
VRKVDEGTGQAGPFQFETYAQVAERVVKIAAALKSLNIEEKACIGLYSVNRPEWVIAEHACYANNFVTVPLYDTLGEESIVHIFSQTDTEVVFASADKVNPPIRPYC